MVWYGIYVWMDGCMNVYIQYMNRQQRNRCRVKLFGRVLAGESRFCCSRYTHRHAHAHTHETLWTMQEVLVDVDVICVDVLAGNRV